MYQYKGMTDTIAAIITPLGAGGVGIVRVSGQAALAVAGHIFESKVPTALQDWRGFSVHYGWVKDEQVRVIDEVLLTFMRGPKSYTAEDVIEISCHGGSAVVRSVLTLCLKNGARLAEPGEFTKRAFLNGRIDLAQAEAVMDIVSAKTETALRVCERQLKGELSAALFTIREALMTVLSDIEALLNFPEEQVDLGQSERMGKSLDEALGRINALLATAQCGQILREGVRVVIAGKPNVGKSSLLNALLRVPRAIVTDVAGTTRDVLEEEANINGIPVNLVDTAGILSPRDKVEEEAVRRSHENVTGADIVLLVLDQSMPLEAVDRELLMRIKDAPKIIVLNKTDLQPAFSSSEVAGLLPGARIIEVSALEKRGMDALREAVSALAIKDTASLSEGIIISDLRHAEALRGAAGHLVRAKESIEDGASAEFPAEDIKSAVNALDGITGRFVDDDVIEQIFSKFCIGK